MTNKIPSWGQVYDALDAATARAETAEEQVKNLRTFIQANDRVFEPLQGRYQCLSCPAIAVDFKAIIHHREDCRLFAILTTT